MLSLRTCSVAFFGVTALAILAGGCSSSESTDPPPVTPPPTPTTTATTDPPPPPPPPPGDPALGTPIAKVLSRTFGYPSTIDLAAETGKFVAGDFFEVKFAHASAIATATAVKVETTDGNANFALAPTASKEEGNYVLEVEQVRGTKRSTKATYKLYMHRSLNGVFRCPATYTDKEIFDAAATTLQVSGTFKSYVADGPSISLGFTSETTKSLTLRSDIVLNKADVTTSTLALVKAVYPLSNGNGCVTQYRRLVAPTRPSNYTTVKCLGLVYNAAGKAACVNPQPGSGKQPLVAVLEAAPKLTTKLVNQQAEANYHWPRIFPFFTTPQPGGAGQLPADQRATFLPE